MRYYKEILIIEAIVFGLFWISNEYLATLLTFIAVPIFGGILLISLISEWIERSKITREYFILMAGLALIPALLFVGIFIANDGTSFDWAKE
ncbi:MAG: hypothetical protein WAU01_09305 [Saprospiraceae bacterium]